MSNYASLPLYIWTYNQSKIKTVHIDKKTIGVKSMSKFSPERLTVEYRDGISTTEPIMSRSHTLTHSDFTGQLFLTIGTKFAWDKVNTDMRDEVLGVWGMEGNSLCYNVYVYIDNEGQDLDAAIKRNEVFRRELPLALTAIRYGDRFIFKRYPNLDYALIIVNFMSSYPQLFKQEHWGTFSSYTV